MKGRFAVTFALVALLGGCATQNNAIKWISGCSLLPSAQVITDARMSSVRITQHSQTCRFEGNAPSTHAAADQRRAIEAWVSKSCNATVRDMPTAADTAAGVRLSLSIDAPGNVDCSSQKAEISAPSALEIDPSSRAKNLPRYPSAAARDGGEGRVTLTLLVHPQGNVAGAVVAVSSGNHLLDEAAIEAVSRWRFQPRPQQEGIILASVPVNFQQG